jgi:hypothetical protein
MVSPSFRFAEFLDYVSGRDRDDILKIARTEKLEAEPLGRKVGRYVEQLNGLMGIIRGEIPNGSMPSLNPLELTQIRPLIDDLVARKQLKPELLSVFSSRTDGGS